MVWKFMQSGILILFSHRSIVSYTVALGAFNEIARKVTRKADGNI